jgi:hypothetical protein
MKRGISDSRIWQPLKRASCSLKLPLISSQNSSIILQSNKQNRFTQRPVRPYAAAFLSLNGNYQPFFNVQPFALNGMPPVTAGGMHRHDKGHRSGWYQAK